MSCGTVSVFHLTKREGKSKEGKAHCKALPQKAGCSVINRIHCPVSQKILFIQVLIFANLSCGCLTPLCLY